MRGLDIPPDSDDAVAAHPDRDETAALFRLHAEVPARTYLGQMWDRRSFAVAMPAEEVRSAHQDSLLGNIWHLANPLLTVAVYFLVFGVFLRVDRDIPNYLLWLSVGVFAFGLTTRSVLAGATSITSNAGLMRAMRFPRALLPVSTVLGRLLTFAFELAALGIVAIISGEGLSRRLIALPLVLLLHTVLNLGLAFIAARLNDSYQDVQQLIPFVFRLLMYLSGVMFPVRQYLDREGTPDVIKRMISLNPMVQLLDLYRWVFLGTPVDLLRTAEFVGIAVVLLIFGFRFFRVSELAYGRS